MKTLGKWIVGILAVLLSLLVVLLVVAFGVLLYLRIPQNAAGLAAKSVCSARFVAGRPQDAGTLMSQDVLPASPALSLISTSINEDDHSVTSRFFYVVRRQASLISGRGCVLDEDPDPSATPYVAAPPKPGPWPAGDGAIPQSQWGSGIDAPALQQVVDQAFVGEGDPEKANARAVAVVHDGKLLIAREGKDFAPNTALHGWSMTKTVAAMLFYKRAAEVGLDINTPVVNAFRPGREPSWVADWRKDSRANITVADLLYMRDGLQNDEGYDVVGSVVQMLYGEPNMAAWAAGHPAGHPAGTYWQYLSATANILSDVTKGQFDTDAEYWAYSKSALFDPIGVTTATLETDTSGTWVGSSYLWASVYDWSRLGLLMLNNGQWNGTQVLPTSWVKTATTPAMPSGDGHGYGAQTWLPGDPVGGECKSNPGVPADTMMMEGHWGQIVAMIPSRDLVIVRMGWTFNSDQFDSCQFIANVTAAVK